MTIFSASKWWQLGNLKISTENVKRFIQLQDVVIFIALARVDFSEFLHFKNVTVSSEYLLGIFLISEIDLESSRLRIGVDLESEVTLMQLL